MNAHVTRACAPQTGAAHALDNSMEQVASLSPGAVCASPTAPQCDRRDGGTQQTAQHAIVAHESARPWSHLPLRQRSRVCARHEVIHSHPRRLPEPGRATKVGLAAAPRHAQPCASRSRPRRARSRTRAPSARPPPSCGPRTGRRGRRRRSRRRRGCAGCLEGLGVSLAASDWS